MRPKVATTPIAMAVPVERRLLDAAIDRDVVNADMEDVVVPILGGSSTISGNLTASGWLPGPHSMR